MTKSFGRRAGPPAQIGRALVLLVTTQHFARIHTLVTPKNIFTATRECDFIVLAISILPDSDAISYLALGTQPHSHTLTPSIAQLLVGKPQTLLLGITPIEHDFGRIQCGGAVRAICMGVRRAAGCAICVAAGGPVSGSFWGCARSSAKRKTG